MLTALSVSVNEAISIDDGGGDRLHTNWLLGRRRRRRGSVRGCRMRVMDPVRMLVLGLMVVSMAVCDMGRVVVMLVVVVLLLLLLLEDNIV